MLGTDGSKQLLIFAQESGTPWSVRRIVSVRVTLRDICVDSNWDKE